MQSLKKGCRGREARQRSATPCTSVRIRSTPLKPLINPSDFLEVFILKRMILHRFSGKMNIYKIKNIRPLGTRKLDTR